MSELRVVSDTETEIANISNEEENNEELTSYSKKIDILSESVKETNTLLENLASTEDRLANEDIIVQEKNWLEERTRQQREAEDTYRKELIEKQKLLDERRKTQADNFYDNKKLQYYNRMHEAEQTELIYSLHGISSDKVEGMREYKNALFQGAAVMLFFTGLALSVYSYFKFGVESSTFLILIALLATQTALLPKSYEVKAGIYGRICRILSLLPTPLMGLIVASNSLHFLPGILMLEIASAMALTLCFIGAFGFYVRNPYRKTRGLLRKASLDIKDIKKTASKTVKKNIKLRKKLELKLQKKKDKQESQLERLKAKEKNKLDKKKRLEEEKAGKLALKLELQKEKHERMEELLEVKRLNKEKSKELRNDKIIVFKERIAGIWSKKKTEVSDENETSTDNLLNDNDEKNENEEISKERIDA